ncbi:MAG: Uma2 family endonuclease [Armatimonadota bacterium]|nr:Uma2 family endonuclease [Armatimonadota bacterium]
MKDISSQMDTDVFRPDDYHSGESTDRPLPPITFDKPLLPHGTPENEFAEDENFDYGYRYVYKIEPDGEKRLTTVPLTREDIIYPKMEDVQLHNDPHQVFCNYLFSLFKSQLRSDASAVVFHDTGIFWDDPKLRHNSPDVTVILGVKKQKRWTSFYVAREKVRPELVIEVTSPDTRSIDLVDKLRIYKQARVPFYVIVETDRKHGVDVERLHGYHLTAPGYEEIPADERGWLWLETVQLFIGIHDAQVVCYDRSGRRMGDFSEVTAEREATHAALEATEKALNVAEDRIRELEAELRQRNGAS